MKKRIALITVVYGQKEITEKTISLIKKQTLIPDIFVIDNCSEDETPEYLSNSHPDINVIRLQKNYGSSGGQYIGIKLAMEKEYDYIILSDNDAMPLNNNLIEILVENCTENAISQPWNVDEDFGDKSGFWMMHFCCYPIKFFKKVGLPVFDFFIYGDDMELQRRAIKRGFELRKLRQVKYSHPMKRSYSPNLFYFKVRNSLYIMGKYDRSLSIIFNLFILLNSLFVYKMIGEKDYYKFGLLGIKDFFKNNLSNNKIKERSKIYRKLCNENMNEFKSKFNKSFVNIDYKSNKILNFKYNYFKKTKSFLNLYRILRSKYALQESIVSNESLPLSFLSQNIVCLDVLDNKTVNYRIYKTGNVVYKLFFIIIYNSFYLPLIIVLFLKLLFFVDLPNKKLGNVENYVKQF